MLSLLKIQNLALVESLVWELGPGLVGITGETGAGKSVIVGALKLLLGERADRGLVRTGADACSVEAVFELERPDEVNAVLGRFGFGPCEGGQLVLRRSVAAAGGKGGQNKQFVNCSPVTLGVLKALGEHLVDLHGPHDHQSLLSRDRQLAMLDAFARAEREAAACSRAFRTLRDLKAEYETLANSERATEREIDLLRHQIAEIDAAALESGEAEELERRYRIGSNSRGLLELTAGLSAALDGEDGSVLGTLAELARSIRELEKQDPAAAEFTGCFDTALVELEELADHLRRYADGLEIDPAELAEIEARLDLVETLKRKYGNTLDEVIAFRDEAEEKLANIEDRGGQLERLAAAIAEAEDAYRQAAKKLGAKRRKAAPKLGEAVAAHLADLGFARADFGIALEPVEKPAAGGSELAEFQFSPNPGEPPKPLRLIASSGEMSRVMLALKSALAREDSIPLLVFDEIDANVGGEIARAVGAKMASLGASHQVLAITHLPGVASLAHRHFLVEKAFGKDDRTRSTLRELTGESRIAELARMLGGTENSAKKHARNLLRAA